jgi:hypothetical protein
VVIEALFTTWGRQMPASASKKVVVAENADEVVWLPTVCGRSTATEQLRRDGRSQMAEIDVD